MKTIIIAKSVQIGVELARRLGMKQGTYQVPTSVDELRGTQNATILLVDGWDTRKDVSVPDMTQALDTLRLFGSPVYRLSPVAKVR